MTIADPHRFAKLAGCHPDLTRKVRAVVLAMKELGYHMIVTDGVRTTEEQQALYRKGRDTVGPNVRPGRPFGDTVTNADGVRSRSNHQPHVDGYGHAVDCAFIVNGKATWDDSMPWSRYKALAVAVGLKHGVTGRIDMPHVELI